MYFSENEQEIVEYCNKNNCIIIQITKTFDDRYKKLLAKCKEYNVPIISIDDKQIKNVNKIIDKYNSINVFFDINIADINSWYNWNIVIENNLNNILLALDKYSIEELKTNTIAKVEDCNIKSPKGKYDKTTGGYNIIGVLKIIDKLLNNKNNKNCDIIANIFTGNKQVNYHYIKELSEVIKVLTYSNITDRYNYIYDLLCNKLEKDIEKYNYCIFIDNKCIAQRNKAKWPENEYNGCCFDVTKKEECKYLNSNKSCDITCISCRVFTCRYLKDRGIDYDIRKNIFSKIFMNLLQRPVFVWNFFTPKEKILNSVKRYRILR